MNGHGQAPKTPQFGRTVRRLAAALLLGYILFLAYAMLNWPEKDERALVEFLLQKAIEAEQQTVPETSSNPEGAPSAPHRKTQPAPQDETRAKQESARGGKGEPATHPSPK